MITLHNLKDKVVNSFLAKKFYSGLFYFEQGKGQLNRFWAGIPELIIILGGLKYLFNIEFSKQTYMIMFVVLIFLFVLFGYIIKQSGLYDAERYVLAGKDPVTSELLSAARKINKRR